MTELMGYVVQRKDLSGKWQIYANPGKDLERAYHISEYCRNCPYTTRHKLSVRLVALKQETIPDE